MITNYCFAITCPILFSTLCIVIDVKSESASSKKKIRVNAHSLASDSYIYKLKFILHFVLIFTIETR